MSKFIKLLSLFLTMLIMTSPAFSKEIKISDNLTLYKLSEHSYVHKQGINNGLIYINNGEAIIVSTPASGKETQNLIDWVRKEKQAKIIGYIIDRWHPDAMGGLDVVHKNGITSYAYELTRKIAKEKGLPVPEIGFSPKKIINVGNSKVICHFLGEAHTTDGIVVWVPDEKILFGGNEIRNYHGWIGNIGNANLNEWSNTATNIKKEYGSATIVVPGHGKYGGSELIDYTISLYKLPKNHSQITRTKTLSDYKPNEHKALYIKAESDLIQGDKRVLKNASVIVQDATKYVEIESPHIVYTPTKQSVNSEEGRLKIYDKRDAKLTLRTDVNYKTLIVYKMDESVGLIVVLKEITSTNI